ncbi:hypothetical protein ARZXY2_1611 [Arthrobacter sp. ZXY-2]|nr:hypothetical protein ARZXY2_1611 [Arthrobacter sp. ZXY-2]
MGLSKLSLGRLGFSRHRSLRLLFPGTSKFAPAADGSLFLAAH